MRPRWSWRSSSIAEVSAHGVREFHLHLPCFAAWEIERGAPVIRLAVGRHDELDLVEVELRR